LGSKKFAQYADEITRSLSARMQDEMLATAARIEAADETHRLSDREAGAIQSVLALITPRTPPEWPADYCGRLLAVRRPRPAR